LRCRFELLELSSNRYTPGMRSKILSSAAVILLVLAAMPALAASTAGIAGETQRLNARQGHIINFWWLPVEYWVAAAREMKKSQTQIEGIRELFKNYTLLGALDAQLGPEGSVDALSTSEIVRRIEIEVNGSAFEVLQQVDPKLQQYAPDLSYVLQVSLSAFGTGLRLLPLANVDSDGKAILRGDQKGVIKVRYKARADQEPLEFWWHGPLTDVVGYKTCPGSGAPMEASWEYCPWNGQKAR
jgi:hypothetical protein